MNLTPENIINAIKVAGAVMALVFVVAKQWEDIKNSRRATAIREARDQGEWDRLIAQNDRLTAENDRLLDHLYRCQEQLGMGIETWTGVPPGRDKRINESRKGKSK